MARNTGAGGNGIYVTDWLTTHHSTVMLTNTIFADQAVGINLSGDNALIANGILWHNTPVTVAQSINAEVNVRNQHTGDPLFAADGYHIRPGSAALDIGVDAGVFNDIDGHSRYYGAAPDLGCDEIIATTVPTDTQTTLVYTNPQSLTTSVQIPAGAVSQTTTLIYTPLESVTAPGWAFAGHAFELGTWQGSLRFDLRFNLPVTVTIHYADADVYSPAEGTLTLKRWRDGTWEDAGCGIYQRALEENWIAIPICQSGRLALFADMHLVYLPIVERAD